MKNNLLALKVPGSQGSVEIQAPSGIPTGAPGEAGQLVGFAVAVLLVVVILLAFFVIVYAGFRWITSEGDKERVVNARRTIIYALIGLLIAFLSFFGISLFGSLFGIDILKVSF